MALWKVVLIGWGTAGGFMGGLWMIANTPGAFAVALLAGLLVIPIIISVRLLT